MRSAIFDQHESIRSLTGACHSRTWRSRAVLALAALLVAALWVGPAHAKVLGDQPTQGTLLIASDDPGKVPAAFPLTDTQVIAHIAGFAAQVHVRQTFNNPFTTPLEAVYVFPLPQNAAVGEMSIHIGDRVVRSSIERRAEARRIYEAAKREGKTTALLEQQRPNVFTQSVANIEPGKEVHVEIVYDVALAYDAGAYEFVYPMVVGPRYIPGAPIGNSGGGRVADTDRVPDASQITPPVRKPGTRSGHDISIEVTIDPGMPLQSLASSTHEILVEKPDDPADTSVTIRLAPGDRIPNKDLVVRYRLTDDRPGLALMAQKGRDGGYFALMFEPPVRVEDDAVRPKEIFFVVDTSGSMSGEPMSLVKRAMRYAVKNLNPEDTFQIIRFSNSASSLGSRPLANTPANVRQGLSYVNGMSGGGGTHMLAGVRAALQSRDRDGRLRIVCFMTDGYIGNETEILAEIERLIRPDTRLFAFGVGSSVNRYLLDRMAEVGRGAVQYMLLSEPPEAQVARFYNRMRSPLLSDIEVDWGDLAVHDVSPARIPDLFAGQPLTLVGRYTHGGADRVRVNARAGGTRVTFTLPLVLPTGAGGEDYRAIGRLWARSRIRQLMTRMNRGERPELVEAVTRIALEHSLVSKYTSFVAVDERVVNEGGAVRTVQVPVEMPQGVLYGTTIGGDHVADDEAIVVTGGSMRLRPRAWRLAVGAGIGAFARGGDAELATSLHVRVDRGLAPGLAVGLQAALASPEIAVDGSLFNILAEIAYAGLLDGWLHLTLGLGPAFAPGGDEDSALGLGYLGSVQVALPFARSLGLGLELRYDGARVGGTNIRNVGLGLELSF